MEFYELAKALRAMKVETGSLVCLGCRYENNCGIKGCAILVSYNTYFPMTTTSETCSECNVRSAFLGKKSYVKDNRCPNCGAKMDLEG